MKNILLSLLLLSTTQLLLAQTPHPEAKRANHWIFGEGIGLDFSSGQGVLDTSFSTTFFAREACATMSDTAGNLLFYTNGDSVWNRQHQVMPNGLGLLGCFSATQGALIVPKPLSPNVYYIFTTSWGCFTPTGGLYYSTVDMNLNGGLGDVVTKNILLHHPVTEQLTAVHHCNGSDVWVTTHELNSNAFYTYLVDDSGVDTTPVISNIGSTHPSFFPNCIVSGEMKFSPNGKKLAVAAATCSDSFSIREIFDFNSQTGTISNLIAFPKDSLLYYSLSFSPNSSKLYYASSFPYSEITQYDVTIVDSLLLLQSEQFIYKPNNLNTIIGLQLSNTGQLYINRFFEDTIDLILNPNASSSLINYQPEIFTTNRRYTYESFPDYIESYFTNQYDTSCTSTNSSVVIENFPQIKTYPNPFYQTITLEFDNTSQKTTACYVYNSLGRIVYQCEFSSSILDLTRANLSQISGFYFIKLIQEGKTIATGKIQLI